MEDENVVFYFDTKIINSNTLGLPLEVTLKEGDFVTITSIAHKYYLSFRSQITGIGDRFFTLQNSVPFYLYSEDYTVRVNVVKNLKQANKQEQKMKTIKEQLAEFGAEHNDLVILKDAVTGEFLDDTYKLSVGPEHLHYLYNLDRLEPGINSKYRELSVSQEGYEVVAVYSFVEQKQCILSDEYNLKYRARTKKKERVVELPTEIEQEINKLESLTVSYPNDRLNSLRNVISKYLVPLLGVFFCFVSIAQADVCPFGNCPKVTPLSCYESLTRPECVDTHIDYGNDQEEWEYISSQMPKQIQVAGNYIHSGDNQAEYFRCKYLRERRLRIGKDFSGWVKVNCREYLK